jgi:hypothetical protein
MLSSFNFILVLLALLFLLGSVDAPIVSLPIDEYYPSPRDILDFLVVLAGLVAPSMFFLAVVSAVVAVPAAGKHS